MKTSGQRSGEELDKIMLKKEIRDIKGKSRVEEAGSSLKGR